MNKEMNVEWTKVFLMLYIMGSFEDVSLHRNSIKRKLKQTLRAGYLQWVLPKEAVDLRDSLVQGTLISSNNCSFTISYWTSLHCSQK